MIQSGYPMQASSHIGRTNPKITTPSLRNGTVVRFVIDVFLNVITPSLIFLRVRVLKTFSPDLFFQEGQVHKELPPGIDPRTSALSNKLSDIMLGGDTRLCRLIYGDKLLVILFGIIKQFLSPFPSNACRYSTRFYHLVTYGHKNSVSQASSCNLM